MDISNLSLAELRELERLLPKEIRRREQEEKVKVRKELEAFVQARGFSLDDVIRGEGGEKSRGGKVEIKYRHPVSGEGWTGRGRKPRWVEAWLAQGGTLDQLRV